MSEFLASGINVTEESPNIRNFPEIPTAVVGAIGISQMGPIATPTLLTGYSEYERIFGGFVADRELAQAVRAFFLNGGQQIYVSRTCHYDAGVAQAAKGYTVLNTAGSVASAASVTGTVTATWALTPGDTLIGSVGAAADQTATFNAGAAINTGTNDEPFVLSDGDTLTVKVNGGTVQTIILAGLTGGAATAEEVSQSINAQIDGARALVTGGTKVAIQSDRKGSSASIEVTGGTAATVLGLDAAVHAGTGNVSNIDSVAFAEAKAIIEAAWTSSSGVVVASASGALVITTVATGATASIQVKATSTAELKFGLDTILHQGSDAAEEPTLKIWGKTPGAYANDLRIQIANTLADPSGTGPEFNLYVIRNSTIIESFANLTMDTTATRYAPTYLGDDSYGSKYITGEDLSATGTPTTRRPKNVSSQALALGSDGLTGLTDTDFIGEKSSSTGFYAFDSVEDPSIFICPDSTANAVQKAMVTYCRSDKKGLAVCIIDPGASLSATQVISQYEALGSEGIQEHAIMYWPRLKIVNPSKTIFGSAANLVVVPSGTVAGIMARSDKNQLEGPFAQPAGTEFGIPYGVVGLEMEEVILEEKRKLVFPKRINPITFLKGYGIFVDGARVLKGDGNFPYVGARRGVSYVETLLIRGLQWVRHRNNTPTLRSNVGRQVEALLKGFMTRNCFASTDPETAYFVDVSDAINPPSVVNSGKLVIRIGMATNTPSEFIEILVTKDTRALEAELAS